MVIIDKGLAPYEVKCDLRFPMKNWTYDSLIQKIGYNVGKILKSNANRKLDVEWKKKDDPVTYLDRQMENIIKDYFQEHFVSNFLGEEYGFEDNGSPVTVIIDPLDGTKSYIKKMFDSTVSIAIEVGAKVKHSCVYDFMRDIMYIGNENEKNWYVSGCTTRLIRNNPLEILVGGKAKKLERKIDKFKGIRSKRQSGSIALSMAQTAFGMYDGIAFYTPDKGSSWDVAAGHHMLSINDEFDITDFFGKPFDYRNPKNGLIALRKDLPSCLDEVFLE